MLSPPPPIPAPMPAGAVLCRLGAPPGVSGPGSWSHAGGRVGGPPGLHTEVCPPTSPSGTKGRPARWSRGVPALHTNIGNDSLQLCWYEDAYNPSWVMLSSSFKRSSGTSLVVQWLRLPLPMQGVWVQLLVWELRSPRVSGPKN